MILNSDEVPDVMEYNKGNATSGFLSANGLLTDITDVAVERGWDQLLSPGLQTTSRYENGIQRLGAARHPAVYRVLPAVPAHADAGHHRWQREVSGRVLVWFCAKELS